MNEKGHDLLDPQGQHSNNAPTPPLDNEREVPVGKSLAAASGQ